MTTPLAAMGNNASHVEDTQYCGFNINALPQELLMQVLLFVPPTDVVKRCSLVCKLWLRVVRDQALWRRKCEEEDKYWPGVMGPPPENFMLFYFQNPYRRNLLKNTHAASLKHWLVTERPVSVENKPAGVDPIEDHVPAEERGGTRPQNWVTSYTQGSMSQVVRLLDEGCSTEVLDQLKPPIQVSAWCAARWDCGSVFVLTAVLRDEDDREIDRVRKDMDLVSDALRRAWHKVEHTFTSYKEGVRSVQVTLSGIDRQFWAGNYGSKFTLPCLRLVFNK
ncbi:F-box only protein 44-like [Babylonia areolata]|uniref:F-box only protein 44-like n=1 Tax=Babylonia areolata TaxID=304850 RepID=UPI003FD5F001